MNTVDHGHEQAPSATGGGQRQPLLTVVVPAYNSQDYLTRNVDSLLGYGDQLEVLIVDDGSTDGTPELADALEKANPGVVRAIHQENKGHGGALNTGIASAKGIFLKVVDSDDWVDRSALTDVLNQLRTDLAAGHTVDLLVTNFVYEKQGKTIKHTVKYRNTLHADKPMTWDDVKRFRFDQYMTMHSLIYRTQVLRESGLNILENTFYVDYIYAFDPLPFVKTIRYLDVDLYRYFIGREDQSVNEQIMIQRVDQLLRVNKAMVDAMPMPQDVPPNLYRYMVHYLQINCIACSVMLILSKDPKNLALKNKIWSDLAAANPPASRAIRSHIIGRTVALPGPVATTLSKIGYRISKAFVGFN